MNGQGFAILPVDFLLDKFKNNKAVNNFFYRTYNYFPFFDSKQRDETGQPLVTADLINLVSKNLDKRKDCYEEVLKSLDFRKSGRLAYAYARVV